MSGNIVNSIEPVLLKECYLLACQFADSDEAKVLLGERLSRTANLSIPFDTSGGVSLPSSQMQIVSEILQALSAEPQGRVLDRSFGLSHRVSEITDPGEKEYILALIALRDGMDMQRRLTAHRHIRAALSYAQNDPRYRAIAEILRQGG